MPGGITSGSMFELFLYLSAVVANLPVILYNIYKSYKDRTGHMRSFSEAVRPLVPVLLFFTVTSAWVLRSPNLLRTDPRAVYFLTGTIFSNICCRLIVAQMSNTRCELYNFLIIPTALVVLTSLTVQSLDVDLKLTYGLCVFATLAHVHYGTCVVRLLCNIHDFCVLYSSGFRCGKCASIST